MKLDLGDYLQIRRKMAHSSAQNKYFLQEISEHGIFHGIGCSMIFNFLIINRKNVLFTIEWE